MTAHITGIGWVTANGMGCARKQKTFSLADGPLPAVAFDQTTPAARRMDTFSRLGTAALAFALADAGMGAGTGRQNIGIVAATEYGCLNTDLAYFDPVRSSGGRNASPGLFSYTLPSIFLGEAAIRFGLTGPTFVINDAVWHKPTCLELALGCITAGDAQKMLGGICQPEAPPAFRKIRPAPPGALFFMIENSPAGSLSYGKLTLSDERRLLFNGRRIDDLIDLVRQCLAATLDSG